MVGAPGEDGGRLCLLLCSGPSQLLKGPGGDRCDVSITVLLSGARGSLDRVTQAVKESGTL